LPVSCYHKNDNQEVCNDNFYGSEVFLAFIQDNPVQAWPVQAWPVQAWPVQAWPVQAGPIFQ